jgi:phosphatidylglycerol:prolipoprotein diacylglycerol transferase
MYIYNLNPVAFHFFNLEIRYYGMVYAAALLFFYFFLRFISKKKKISNFKEDDVENFLIGLMISTIIGARIFEILFYNPSFYFTYPLEMLKIWHGGLSFNGGILFGTIWIYIYCKVKKISFFKLTDFLVIPLAVFLALGRLANFLNGELRGLPTSAPIGIIYPGETIGRWPTQIFESLKNVIIFVFLYLIWLKKDKIFEKYSAGILTAFFLILYGTFRFCIEFLKEGDKVIFNLNTSQIFCIISIITGIFIYIYVSHHKK